MKVLYLAHPEGDFGGSFVYNGLVELCGKENVVDYPRKVSYHGTFHEYDSPWYGEGNRGGTGVYQWMTFQEPDDFSWDKQQVEEMIKAGEFSFVLVESPRFLSMQALRDFRGLIDEQGLAVVLAEGEDYSGYDLEKLKEIRPDVYLKRELRKEGKHASHTPFFEFKYAPGKVTQVIGFPFSSPVVAIDRAPVGEAYDVFFSCGNTTINTTNMRQRVADALRAYTERAGIKSYIAIAPDFDKSLANPNLLGWEQYAGCMKASKVLVNCRGFGYDTARYWEAAGAGLLCTEPIGLTFEGEYSGMQNVVEFDSPESCVGRIEALLSDDVLASSIREACNAHTRQFHTNLARAERLVDRLRRMGKLKGVV